MKFAAAVLSLLLFATTASAQLSPVDYVKDRVDTAVNSIDREVQNAIDGGKTVADSVKIENSTQFVGRNKQQYSFGFKNMTKHTLVFQFPGKTEVPREIKAGEFQTFTYTGYGPAQFRIITTAPNRVNYWVEYFVRRGVHVFDHRPKGSLGFVSQVNKPNPKFQQPIRIRRIGPVRPLRK